MAGGSLQTWARLSSFQLVFCGGNRDDLNQTAQLASCVYMYGTEIVSTTEVSLPLVLALARSLSLSGYHSALSVSLPRNLVASFSPLLSLSQSLSCCLLSISETHAIQNHNIPQLRQ